MRDVGVVTTFGLFHDHIELRSYNHICSVFIYISLYAYLHMYSQLHANVSTCMNMCTYTKSHTLVL